MRQVPILTVWDKNKIWKFEDGILGLLLALSSSKSLKLPFSNALLTSILHSSLQCFVLLND
jgi:hypothetical protein